MIKHCLHQGFGGDHVLCGPAKQIITAIAPPSSFGPLQGLRLINLIREHSFCSGRQLVKRLATGQMLRANTCECPALSGSSLGVGDAVFWTWQGYLTHELTSAVYLHKTCRRPRQHMPYQSNDPQATLCPGGKWYTHMLILNVLQQPGIVKVAWVTGARSYPAGRKNKIHSFNLKVKMAHT